MISAERVDWSDFPLVEVNPRVQGGQPVLKGTRMPADAIVDNFNFGVEPVEIAAQFELPYASVEAVLNYAQSRRKCA
jgi:uncharacterized protein (DUF433 family)